MSVKMKPGVWRRRDNEKVIVRNDGSSSHDPWIGSDGKKRYSNGQFMQHDEGALDLVEYLGETMEQAQPQLDAAEDLDELRDDRDRWQTRARQAEGRVATLTQEWNTAQRYVSDANEVNNSLTTQVKTLQYAAVNLQQELAAAREQVSDLQAQLEAAVHAPDLSADLERIAAERDAAREQVRGLQVRAEQAEGDARQEIGRAHV